MSIENFVPGEPQGVFYQKVRVSRDMKYFLGIEEGDQLIGRYDVTLSILKYVEDNNLRDPNNPSYFTPDEKLAKLLGTSSPLNRFTLQRVIQPHFLKP
jgi:chromatin remodeling complex protein RSC6